MKLSKSFGGELVEEVSSLFVTESPQVAGEIMGRTKGVDVFTAEEMKSSEKRRLFQLLGSPEVTDISQVDGEAMG